LPPNFSGEDYDKLVNRIQFGGDEVVKAKDGAGSATLSMAYAGAEFAKKILRALKGEQGIVAPSYVSLEADPSGASLLKKDLDQELAYFSSNVEFGVCFTLVSFCLDLTFIPEQPEGVVKIHSLGQTTEAEKKLIKAALPELAKNIDIVCHLCFS